MVNGDTVGTLCVYDAFPKAVSKEQIAQLEVLSKAAMESLAARL